MCVSITGPQTPTTTSNTDLITLAVDYLHFAGCYGRTGQTISRGVNTASNNANLMRSVILQKGSTQDQPQCSVTHFFSKASLSGMKMRTDTFYRHWSAKAWLCLRISSGTLPSLSYSRVVLALPPNLSYLWQGRLEVAIWWKVWHWEQEPSAPEAHISAWVSVLSPQKACHFYWTMYWEHLKLLCLFCFYCKYGKFFGDKWAAR